MTETVDPLVVEIEVACSPEHAFRTWTERASTWWPTAHSVSNEPGLTVTFEPEAGGRIFERAPDGTEHDWGRIIEWDPPRRLVYLWHLVVEPSDATEVEITFAAADGGTSVRLEHRGWERFGVAATERLARNQQGWGEVLPLYQAACA